MEWMDEIHDSSDDFLRSRGVPDPDGSIQASEAIQRDMGLGARPIWYDSVEYPEWDAHLARVQGRNFRIARVRKTLGWLVHPNVILTVALFVAILLVVNRVWR